LTLKYKNIDIQYINNRNIDYNNSIYFRGILLPIILLFIFVFNNVTFSRNKANVDNDGAVRIDSIRIIGNKTTKDFIILRELDFSVGDTVTIKELEYNRSRIISLRLFYSVTLNVVPENGKNILVITVEESWYIFPVPFFNLQSNKLSRSTYGMILNWKNFRGRNETIHGLISLGYNPSFRLLYLNPVIIKNSEISFFSGISKQTVNNQSKLAETIAGNDFDYKVLSMFAGLGYRLNNYNEVSFTIGYEYIKSPFEIRQITASGNKSDKMPTFSLLYKHDTRDLKQYPEKGVFSSVFIKHKGFGLKGISYFITGFDFREYRKIFSTNFTAKWRIAFRKVFGKTVPLYDYSYLGFNEFMRGHKNDEREGENSIIGSLELSYSLIKEWVFSLKLPLLPSSMTSYLISIRLSIFGDTGTTFNNDEPIMINRFDTGYGFGLTILFLPYNAFRFEYAFNEYGKGEFLFGTKFPF